MNEKFQKLEVIPYFSLDEQLELALKLEDKKRNKEFRNYHDLGNCFLIIHHMVKDNKRVI